MQLVMTLVVREEADLLDALLAYHLSAGVEHIVVCDLGSSEHARAIVAEYARTGAVISMSAAGVDAVADARTRMERTAIDRLGAEWLIESDADEFWWPRGVSLRDVLAPIPQRYTSVQALVRVFSPRGEGADFFAERMTVRGGLQFESADPEPLAWALKPVYRVRGGHIVRAGARGSVPLRAWYPIEVLRFPLRTPEQAAALVGSGSHEARSRLEAAFIDQAGEGAAEAYARITLADEEVAHGLKSMVPVEDVRLRDVLRELRTDDDSVRRFVPCADVRGVTTPTIVDEAAYAVECAAVGEVDLAGVDRHIRELEGRIATLEQRLWPRVMRRASMLVRGRVRPSR